MRRPRVLFATLLLLPAIVVSSGAASWGRGAPSAEPVTDLQAVLDTASDGDTIRLGPGVYRATPRAFRDPLCGNCVEHRTPVEASVGFRVVGMAIVLIGAGPAETTLITGAGYGMYFEDAGGSAVENLSVTGGRRDPDGNATDAAIVVRGGAVRLRDLWIRDNTDRVEDVVVGIAGVVGREGAEIEIRRCRILNNGWDGIALYRGAMATIADNVIEGGRGAGIGITWDAAALVVRNRISGYWKGIGTFGSSRAVVRNNAVFDNLGWGIIATGDSFLEATHNVVVRNGNCGFAVWSEGASGRFADNVALENGWRKEWVCPRVGFWHRGRQERFPVDRNLVDGNVFGAWRSETGEEAVGPLLEENPRFRGPVDFRPGPRSPLADGGDPEGTDRDGSRSDLGLSGGAAGRSGLGAPPRSLPAERHRIGSAAWEETR
ncbi:MAG: hypothetical protein GF346_10050 [Candidatus Eisenbacteria bacterium]|nr:hypothetical protein [Candidatus Latescibacterota bacterium]MBD3302776.1 hypothetical protein [Candidatus Eisenbacteria bacterium]